MAGRDNDGQSAVKMPVSV